MRWSVAWISPENLVPNPGFCVLYQTVAFSNSSLASSLKIILRRMPDA